MTTMLLVDDDADARELLADTLAPKGYVVLHASSGDDAVRILETEHVDAVVTDVRMGGMDGLALCRHITATRGDTRVVVVTAFGDLDTAVAAMRAGAADFLTKPFDPELVLFTLDRILEPQRLRRELHRLREAMAVEKGFGQLVGRSEVMRNLYAVLAKVAATDASVLITGESGTGKELIARALHERGPRKGGPFVAINCAALPESLMESELFGHVRGAFTGALANHTGVFVQAHGGTVFLDEIAELPMPVQSKLLRALQERTVRPVGGSREIPFDARVLSATNRDLDAAVERGQFRGDLFYRLDVVNLAVPPLRARGDDILLLAEHFLARLGSAAQPLRLDHEARARLLAYPWPGNVRELENCLARAVALADGPVLTVADLPDKVRRSEPGATPSTTCPGDLPSMDQVERRYVLHVLRAVGGNKRRAAQILGFDRKTLYAKLERYGPNPDESL